jgi:hypothetical protein
MNPFLRTVGYGKEFERAQTLLHRGVSNRPVKAGANLPISPVEKPVVSQN